MQIEFAFTKYNVVVLQTPEVSIGWQVCTHAGISRALFPIHHLSQFSNNGR
jgi:hypothetical protein